MPNFSNNAIIVCTIESERGKILGICSDFMPRDVEFNIEQIININDIDAIHEQFKSHEPELVFICLSREEIKKTLGGFFDIIPNTTPTLLCGPEAYTSELKDMYGEEGNVPLCFSLDLNADEQEIASRMRDAVNCVQLM